MDKNKGHVTNHKWLSIALFAGGTIALGLTGIMNFKLGQSLGADYISGLIQGSSHIVIDGFAALGFVTAGVLIARKNAWAGAGALVLSLCFAGYSIANVVGYGASNRVAIVSASTQNQIILAQRADEATAARADLMKWLQSTAVDKSKYRSMREPMADAMIKLVATAPPRVRKLSAHEIMPDAQSEIIAELTGTDQHSAQIALSVAMAVLLVMAKAFGFGFGGFLWPEKAKSDLVKPVEHKPDIQPDILSSNVVHLATSMSTVNLYSLSKPDHFFMVWPKIYSDYTDYCGQIGRNPVTRPEFGRQLLDCGWKKHRENQASGKMVYRKMDKMDNLQVTESLAA